MRRIKETLNVGGHNADVFVYEKSYVGYSITQNVKVLSVRASMQPVSVFYFDCSHPCAAGNALGSVCNEFRRHAIRINLLDISDRTHRSFVGKNSSVQNMLANYGFVRDALYPNVFVRPAPRELFLQNCLKFEFA